MRATTADHAEHDELVARSSEHPTHTEWYLTARPIEGARSVSDDGAGRVFEAVAERIVAEGMTVLQEKVYCLGRARDAVLERRTAALAQTGVHADWPVTALEGTPASGAEFGGVQLWGVTMRPDAGQRIETVDLLEHGARIRGREWLGPDFRLLVLSSIDGLTGASAGAASAPEQARLMFERASVALAARGYSFHQVARTWIYLARILDWYGEFNRVRNAHFRTVGLSIAGQAPFPASTGIQARHGAEQCLMDLLAVITASAERSPGLLVRPVLRSERQDDASSYGSAFARAMVLERAGGKLIHVSGTASIDGEGNSTYPGDVAAQYCGTLLNIAALLEQEGASLADIGQGTLFAKSAAVARTCREVARRLGLPILPLVEVIADVCRPELLVEIEAIAFAPRGTGTSLTGR